MLFFPPAVKIFVAASPTDLRKSFDTLAAIVSQGWKRDPLSGHLYVFFNRKANRVKALYWDVSGFALWSKRLESGRFHVRADGEGSVEMSAGDLGLVLEGVDLAQAKRRKRYRRPPA